MLAVSLLPLAAVKCSPSLRSLQYRVIKVIQAGRGEEGSEKVLCRGMLQRVAEAGDKARSLTPPVALPTGSHLHTRSPVWL